MASRSPSRRLRTKTSDLTEFFRGSSSHGHQSRQTPNDAQLQIPVPPLPETPQTTEASAGLKKMSTRIPFLGRSRKKSTHSTSGSPLPSTSSSRGYDSTEIAESTTSKKDRRRSQPVSSSPPPAASNADSLPSTLPPINVSSPSLGSKFAAHFTPSKPRKPSPRRVHPTNTEGNASDMLSPPINPRNASFDSTSSGGSANRSPTPRAALQPTITVSLSSDDLDDNFDEYKDLFTLPRKKISTQKRHPSTPASEYRDTFHDGDSNVTLSPTPPTSPRMQFPNPPPDTRTSSIRLPGSTRRDSRSSAEDGSSQHSQNASIRLASSGSRRRKTSKADDSAEESSGPQNTTGIPGVGPAIDVSPPSPVVLKSSMSLHRSRLRAPTTSQPPTIPLPDPPKSSPPPSTPSIQPSQSTRSPGPSSSPTPVQRRRANTIGTVPLSPQPSSPIAAISPSGVQKRIKVHSDNASPVKQYSYKEAVDPKTATPDELRSALEARNRDYAELVGHLEKITAAHLAEKKAWEKKISALEKDMLKKDNELRGFAWLVNNPPHGGANPLNQNQVAYRQAAGPPPKVGFRALHDDSGAESHHTSGGESFVEAFRGISTSGTDSPSSMRMKRIMRPTVLADTGFILGRAPSTKSTRGLGIDSETPHRSSLSQRSSVYSLSSSSTSSASSLLPPSPSGTTMSSLSAIPESPTYASHPPPRPPRVSGSLSAGEAEGQRHTPRAFRRISTPPPVSSSTSQATNAYSANLKRGRPPSIAQVLDKSPPVQEMLESRRRATGSP